MKKNKIFRILVICFILPVLAFSGLLFACSTEEITHELLNVPRIHISTKNNISLTDRSLQLGYNKGLNKDVMEYDYVSAKFSIENCNWGGTNLTDLDAQVKVRGNYSSTFPKKPIRIKFNKKQNLCGLNDGEKFKNWVLLNEYKDSSMLRNTVTMFLGDELFNEEGYYCTDYTYVEVYINGEYNGLYLLAEQQEVKEERVSLPEAIDPEDEPDNENLENNKIGYFFEYDGYYINEKPLETFTLNYNKISKENGTLYTPSQKGYTIASDIYFESQKQFLKKTVQNIWNIAYDILYNDHTDLTTNPFYTLSDEGEMVEDLTIKSKQEAISKVIDIESLVNMTILQEICMDADVSFSSFYLSLDMSSEGNHLLTFTAPWDFDSSLGQMTVHEQNKNKFYATNSTNPWLTICSTEQWFWELFEEEWDDLKEDNVFANCLNLIETYTKEYEKAYHKNYLRWPDSIGRRLESSQLKKVENFKTQKQASAFLKSWLANRIETIENLVKNKVS